jgi:hypothetical protein
MAASIAHSRRVVGLGGNSVGSAALDSDWFMEPTAGECLGLRPVEQTNPKRDSFLRDGSEVLAQERVGAHDDLLS